MSSNDLGPVILPIFIPSGDAVFNWLQTFVVSPGFGGLAAVVAATIAFFGVRRQINATKKDKKEERWWSTLTWVYDKASSVEDKADPLPKVIAVQVLNELRNTADKMSPLQSQTADALVTLFSNTARTQAVNETKESTESTDSSSASSSQQLLRATVAEYWRTAEQMQPPSSRGRIAGIAYEAQVVAAIGEYATSCGLTFSSELLTKSQSSNSVRRPDAVLTRGGGKAMAIEIVSRSNTRELEAAVINQAKSLIGGRAVDITGHELEIVEAIVVTNASRYPEAKHGDPQIVVWRSTDDDASLQSIVEKFAREPGL